MSNRLKIGSETIVVNPLDRGLEAALRASVDGKVLWVASEDLAVQLGLIQGRPDPRIGASCCLCLPAITG